MKVSFAIIFGFLVTIATITQAVPVKISDDSNEPENLHNIENVHGHENQSERKSRAILLKKLGLKAGLIGAGIGLAKFKGHGGFDDDYYPHHDDYHHFGGYDDHHHHHHHHYHDHGGYPHHFGGGHPHHFGGGHPHHYDGYSDWW